MALAAYLPFSNAKDVLEAYQWTDGKFKVRDLINSEKPRIVWARKVKGQAKQHHYVQKDDVSTILVIQTIFRRIEFSVEFL